MIIFRSTQPGVFREWWPGGGIFHDWRSETAMSRVFRFRSHRRTGIFRNLAVSSAPG